MEAPKSLMLWLLKHFKKYVVVYVLKMNLDKGSSLQVNAHLSRVRDILQLTEGLERLKFVLTFSLAKHAQQ